MRFILLASFLGTVFSANNSECFSAQPPCDGVNLPHGHALVDLVDNGFARIDTDSDGRVTTDEFDLVIQFDDKNNDSCVSFAEYHNAETQELFFEINQRMYEHFDPDKDECLDVDEMNAEFHKIDTDGNGLLEKSEYEHYYTSLLKHLFGPSSCQNGE